MHAIEPKSCDADHVWDRYRHNFFRHVLGVARHLQSSLMDTLQAECGHKNLRLGFSPYITLIGESDKRLTDLAELLGISRQACNQATKQVAAAGYIERKPDPLDGRAKLLALSPEGIRLRHDGMRIVAQLDQQFACLVGEQQIARTSYSLRKIYQELDLGRTPQANLPAARVDMGGLLPRLADYVLQRLMTLTREKGHPGLKLRFGQVLTLIGPSGGRIQQMAAIHDVSKQAISAIACELEELGYLTRETDPADARQIVLTFTTLGEKLIADSVTSVDELEAEFSTIVGRTAYKQMQNTLQALYQKLGLEQEIFEKIHWADIHSLVQKLQQQLGEHDSRALGRLLLSPST